jgi:hypothetical protein
MFLAKKQNKCAIRYQEMYVTRFLVKSVNKFLDKFVIKSSVRSVVISLVKFVSRCPRLNVGTYRGSSALQFVSQHTFAKCARMTATGHLRPQSKRSTEPLLPRLCHPIRDRACLSALVE